MAAARFPCFDRRAIEGEQADAIRTDLWSAVGHGDHRRDFGGSTLAPDSAIFQTVWFGYTVMVVAMIFLFVGVKRYRDVEKGGVIRFLPALGMGLAIGLVAVIAYVVIWEIYLAATHYAFIEEYFSSPAMAELKAGTATR